MFVSGVEARPCALVPRGCERSGKLPLAVLREGWPGCTVLLAARPASSQAQWHSGVSWLTALREVGSSAPISALSADEIVALKRLKMEKEKEGFPITSLREINTILKAQHPNIVTVRVGGPPVPPKRVRRGGLLGSALPRHRNQVWLPEMPRTSELSLSVGACHPPVSALPWGVGLRGALAPWAGTRGLGAHSPAVPRRSWWAATWTRSTS